MINILKQQIHEYRTNKWRSKIMTLEKTTPEQILKETNDLESKAIQYAREVLPIVSQVSKKMNKGVKWDKEIEHNIAVAFPETEYYRKIGTHCTGDDGIHNSFYTIRLCRVNGHGKTMRMNDQREKYRKKPFEDSIFAEFYFINKNDAFGRSKKRSSIYGLYQKLEKGKEMLFDIALDKEEAFKKLEFRAMDLASKIRDLTTKEHIAKPMGVCMVHPYFTNTQVRTL